MNEIEISYKEAIKAIKSNKPTSGYSILCEALDMAVIALEEKAERENQKPLTLKDLQQMVGQPVWLVCGLHLDWDNYEQWCLISSIVPKSNFIHFVGIGTARSCDIEEYGTHWLAYRHPPKAELEEQEGDE